MATSTDSSAIVRILLATCLVSVAALGVGLYGLLRAPVPARASAPDELAVIRSDLAELRHSLDVTRSQQTSAGAGNTIAELERRLAQLEASARLPRPTAAPAAPSAPAEDERRPDDLSPAELRERVAIERSPDGVVTSSVADPALVNAALQRR